MFDIDYILGTKKKSVSKKTSKDPLRDIFIGKGNPIIRDRITPQQRKVLKGPSKYYFGDWDKDGVINALDCQPRNRDKHMAEFKLQEYSTLNKIDWKKDQRGKKLGEGHFANVYEVKDNPNYSLKIDKSYERNPSQFSQGELRSTDREYHKYDYFLRDDPHTIPMYPARQGIVKPNINPITTGMSKENHKSYGLNKSAPKLSYEEAQKLSRQINSFSNRNIDVGDEIQVGRSKDGEVFIFDLGEFSQQPDYRSPGVISSNRDYKKRFLNEVGRPEVLDFDPDAESDLAVKQIENPDQEYYDVNLKTSVAKQMRSNLYPDQPMVEKRVRDINYSKQKFDSGEMEPIEVDETDFKSGILRDGRHRVLAAEKLNRDSVKVRVYPDQEVRDTIKQENEN